MPRTSYVVALGSNRPGPQGSPRQVARAAVEALAQEVTILAVSAIRSTPALGPAGRSFANGALLLSTDLAPPELLELLQALERRFGRRAGRRWGARILDLDIILWSGGAWEGPGLLIPHPEMRRRRFVLDPLAELVPDWRDPIGGATMRQLRARFLAPVPVDRTASPS